MGSRRMTLVEVEFCVPCAGLAPSLGLCSADSNFAKAFALDGGGPGDFCRGWIVAAEPLISDGVADARVYDEFRSIGVPLSLNLGFPIL